jgi:hypothetical protein
MLTLPASDVCHHAMQECIWRSQCSDTDLHGAWVRQLVALISHVCHADTPLSALIDLPSLHLDTDACMSAWRSHYHASAWGGLAVDPRTAPSTGITMCTYHNWFAADLPEDGKHWEMAAHLRTPRLPWHHVQSLTRMRTGCHDLAVQRLRRPAPNGHRVPRAQRVCMCCPPAVADGSRPVQDELHCMLECPSLDDVRTAYPRLFPPGAPATHPDHNATLRGMFTDPALVRPLASFVHTHVLPMGTVGAPMAPAAAP